MQKKAFVGTKFNPSAGIFFFFYFFTRLFNQNLQISRYIKQMLFLNFSRMVFVSLSLSCNGIYKNAESSSPQGLILLWYLQKRKKGKYQCSFFDKKQAETSLSANEVLDTSSLRTSILTARG